MNFSKMSTGKKVFLWFSAVVLFLVTTGIVWYVNHLIPFMMDDDWYATVLSGDAKITNAKDIFEAQKWHYMNWGGRSITHTILQFIILAGSDVADIVNTVMTILTGIIVMAMSETMTRIKRTFVERLLTTTIVMGMILGLNANWKMSMYWQSGSCNYLYITVFILLFIWVYMREIPYECFGSKEPLPLVTLWIIPLGIIAGWSNENMGPVVFIFSVATMIYAKKVGHYVQPWMVLGSLFSFLGSAACIVAPGNFVRSAEVNSAEYGILWKAYLRGFYESRALFEYLIITIIITLVMIALSKSVCSLTLGAETVFILVAALLSWGAMALSPHYPDRATYGTMVLLILAIIAMAQRILERKSALRPWFYTGAFIIWLRGMYYLSEYIGLDWGWVVY